MFVNKNAASHKCLLHNLYHQSYLLFLISYHLLQERVKEASSQRLERYRSYLFQQITTQTLTTNNNCHISSPSPLKLESVKNPNLQVLGVKYALLCAFCWSLTVTHTLLNNNMYTLTFTTHTLTLLCKFCASGECLSD